MSMRIRAKEPSDLETIRRELVRHWGSTQIWSVGRGFDADRIPALLAEIDGKFAGLATYDFHPGGYQCEVVTLSAAVENAGVGAALLDAVEREARKAGCARIFLTTTNDNIRAIRFYQKRGWDLCVLHRGIVDQVRARFKPETPSVGLEGLPIRHELEFEKLLGATA